MNNGSGLDNINRGIDALIRQYSPEQLRRFDTNSWLELYGKIDNLIFSDEICAACAKQKGKRVVRRLFVSENVPAFRYLYEHAAFLRKSLPKSPNSPVKPPETLNKKSPSFSIR
ncbi:MAG: hypothetical protein ACLU99_09290 [Alphaproteobacteria bacterium]